MEGKMDSQKDGSSATAARVLSHEEEEREWDSQFEGLSQFVKAAPTLEAQEAAREMVRGTMEVHESILEEMRNRTPGQRKFIGACEVLAEYPEALEFLTNASMECRAAFRGIMVSAESKDWVANKINVSRAHIEANKIVPRVERAVTLGDIVRLSEDRLSSVTVRVGGVNTSLYSLVDDILVDVQGDNPGVAAMAYRAVEQVLQEHCKDLLVDYQPLMIDPLASKFGAYVDADYVQRSGNIMGVNVRAALGGEQVVKSLEKFKLLEVHPVSPPPTLMRTTKSLALSYLLHDNEEYRKRVTQFLESTYSVNKEVHFALIDAASSNLANTKLLNQEAAKRQGTVKEKMFSALLGISKIAYDQSELGRKRRVLNKVSNDRSKMFMNMFNSDAVGHLYELDKSLPPLDRYDNVIVRGAAGLAFSISLLTELGAKKILFLDEGPLDRKAAATVGCPFIESLDYPGDNFIIDLNLIAIDKKDQTWARWNENADAIKDKIAKIESGVDMVFRFPFCDDKATTGPYESLIRLCRNHEVKIVSPYRLHRPYFIVSVQKGTVGNVTKCASLMMSNFLRVQMAEELRGELIKHGCNYLDELFDVRQKLTNQMTRVIKAMSPKFIVKPRELVEEIPKIELEGGETQTFDFEKEEW